MNEFAYSVGQKSFYGKAETRSGVLYSYGTPVASMENHCFKRHWSGHSATTMRHVNAFRHSYGLRHLAKREWDALYVEEVAK